MTNETIIEDLTLVPVPFWWQNPLVWVGFALAAAGIFYALHRWHRSRPKPPETVPVTPPGPPPHLEALKRLAELRKRQGNLTAYQTAIECSDILRVYISERFLVPMRFQTTREFLAVAQSHPQLGGEQQSKLAALLRFFDQLKFARQTAGAHETLAVIDQVENFIKSCILPESTAEART